MDLYKTGNSAEISPAVDSLVENADYNTNCNTQAVKSRPIPPSLDDVNQISLNHAEHLKSEGFTDSEIDRLISFGVRSISEQEARSMRIGCKNKDGDFVSSSGLYFPFTEKFGQIRCDEPPINAQGKACKYLIPSGVKSDVWMPELDTKILTEGFKDAAAGTLKGCIATGALSGVSHCKNALKAGSKFTILFDSDGWTNHQVFSHLFNAGVYLKGKIQLVPEIPNQPKAGLCEYFKAGYTSNDYRKLIDSAMEPNQFLLELPKHWQGLTGENRQKCVDALLKLAVAHLSKDQTADIVSLLGLKLDDIEKTLFVFAKQIIDKHRKENSFEELAQMQGGYLWSVIASDKIFLDFMKLTQRFGDRLRFNTLKKQVELNGDPLPLGTAKAFLSISHGFQAVTKTDFPDIVLTAAKLRSYSPITEYLDSVFSKHGSNTDILKNLAERYLGQSDPIYNRMLVKTLIGAVARAYQPGCKMDTALILQGDQGVQKSTFFKTLAGGVEYFDDSLGSIGEKDEKLKLHRFWFIEWAELETVFRKKDVAATKAFLSSAVDNVRPPYGRDVEEMPRGSIIVGSTNEEEFLSDSTGNRRFWVIPVLKDRIDIKMLEQERDQIWAAAVALYKQNQQWWLTDLEEIAAAKIASQFQSTDTWFDDVANFIGNKEFVTVSDILRSCLGIDVSRQGKHEQMRVTNVLKQSGFKRVRKTIDGKQIVVWLNPSMTRQTELDEAQPQSTETPSQPVAPDWAKVGQLVKHANGSTFEIKSRAYSPKTHTYFLKDKFGVKYPLNQCEPLANT